MAHSKFKILTALLRPVNDYESILIQQGKELCSKTLIKRNQGYIYREYRFCQPIVKSAVIYIIPPEECNEELDEIVDQRIACNETVTKFQNYVKSHPMMPEDILLELGMSLAPSVIGSITDDSEDILDTYNQYKFMVMLAKGE